MKKLSFESFELLDKSQLRLIKGAFATCVATCAGGGSALCSGTNCVATDNQGCTSDQESQTCSTSGGIK